MNNVAVAEDVRTLLPAAELQTLLNAFAFECVVCAGRGSTQDEPTSVVVRRDSALTTVGIAHTVCAPSGVYEVPGALQVRDQVEMTVQAIAVPGLDGDRPVLVCEIPGLRARTMDGTDLVVPGLRRLGLEPVRRIAATPPVLATWQVHLPDQARARISAPGVEAFYAGPLSQSTAWHAVVRDLGAVVLMSGVGLELQADRDPGALMKVLGRAAQRGDLVGATVPVTG